MKANYFRSGERQRPVHSLDTHILSAVAAVLAFIVVFAYADNPKLYYAIVASALVAGAVYVANYLQCRRTTYHRTK